MFQNCSSRMHRSSRLYSVKYEKAERTLYLPFLEQLQAGRLSAMLFITFNGHKGHLSLLPLLFCFPVWLPQLHICLPAFPEPPTWKS